MQLAITCIGRNRPGIMAELSRTITDCRCNILECRMTALGRELAGHLLVEGNWNHVARLESLLDGLQQRHGVKVHAVRTESPEVEARRLPYTIDAVTADRVAVTHDLIQFLQDHNISIHELTGSSYAASHTGSHLFALHLIVGIPGDVPLISLRDEFLDFCDSLNIDAILEPLKR